MDENTVCCAWPGCSEEPKLKTPICGRHLIDAWQTVEAVRADMARIDPEAFEAAMPGAATGSHREPQTIRALTSVVYYVRLLTGDVKIGYTGQLGIRIAQLRVPFENVLAVEPGALSREQMRHAQFSHLRRPPRIRRGSWPEDFEPTPELMAHIAATREQWGDPREIAASIRDAKKRAG